MNDLNAKKEEFVKQFEGLESTFSEIKMLMTYYECAILEVKTKLDVLNKEFRNIAYDNDKSGFEIDLVDNGEIRKKRF